MGEGIDNQSEDYIRFSSLPTVHMRPGLYSLFSSHINVPLVREISHDQVLNTPPAPAPDPHLSTSRVPTPLHACCQVSAEMESCHGASCIRMMSAGARINYWHAI